MIRYLNRAIINAILLVGLVFPLSISAKTLHSQSAKESATPIDSSVIRLVGLPHDMSDLTPENLAYNLLSRLKYPTAKRKLSSLLKEYDVDKSGALSRLETWNAGFSIFNRIDVNNDGDISNIEIGALPPLPKNYYKYWRKRSFSIYEERHECNLPEIPVNAKIMLVGVHTAEKLSRVSIGGNNGIAGVVDLHIEDGLEKIYLVLSSRESMIWNISGNRDRLTNVVISSSLGVKKNISRSGVIGIPKQRSEFLSTRCIADFHELKVDPTDIDSKFYQLVAGHSDPSDDDAEEAILQFYQLTGREPDIMVAHYSPTSISLPSGKITKTDRRLVSLPPKGFVDPEWSRMKGARPAGIATLRLSKIVTPLKKRRLKLLPEYAGLSQLVSRGILKKVGPWSGLYYLSKPLKEAPLDFEQIVIIVPDKLRKNAERFSELCLVSQETKKIISTNRLCNSTIEYKRKAADF